MPSPLEGLNPSSDPIAVMVFHGIGQQAPFETVNGVLEAFITAHTTDRGGEWELVDKRLPDEDVHALPGEVSFVQLDGNRKTLLPLAEIELKRAADHQRQRFHFYEVYWAPMTEGVVHFLDVLLFLLKAAWDGAWAQIRNRSFARFTFGKEQNYGILTMTGLQLFFAFFTVAGLVLLSAVFFGVLGADVLSCFHFNVRAHFPVEIMRSTLLSFAPTALILAIPPILLALVQQRRNATTANVSAVLNFLCILPLIACIGWFGIATVYTLLSWQPAWAVWWPRGAFSFLPAAIRWIVFAAVGTYVFTQFYLFVVKSVGDVTAYVSAHAVNRFWRVREDIQARALDIARSVYVRKHPESQALLYKHVVLVAHSLGSVIAYEMLNTLISFELTHCADDLSNIASRTRLFLTCGSPLNKIAFLFRFQSGTGKMPRWRELLNNYRQPLILEHDSRHRPQRWINISCFPDWISGRLRYYEPAGEDLHTNAATAFEHYRILERFDPDGIIPLAAHTQYFKHRLFRTTVYEALWQHFGPVVAPPKLEVEQVLLAEPKQAIASDGKLNAV